MDTLAPNNLTNGDTVDNILQHLPGFVALSDRQKKVIEQMLEIQKQADVGVREAMQQIDTWYCHAAALAVECGSFESRILTRIPKNYQACEGKALLNCKSYHKLQNFLDELKPPFVLHMLTQFPDNYLVQHSMISLGRYDNEHYVWEKRAAGEPFMISSVKNLVEIFPGMGWGKRKFTFSTIESVLKRESW